MTGQHKAALTTKKRKRALFIRGHNIVMFPFKLNTNLALSFTREEYERKPTLKSF